MVMLHANKKGDYKHWTEDPRTRGPGTKDPARVMRAVLHCSSYSATSQTYKPNLMVMSCTSSLCMPMALFIANNAISNYPLTCLILSCVIVISSPHFTHKRCSSHQLCYFLSSHSANPRIVSLIVCKTTRVTSCMQGPGVKGFMQIVLTFSCFVYTSWPLQKRCRLH